MSEPYYADDTVTLHHGDCLDVLRALSDASVDAVVTDPPYGLEFMGKAWDKFEQTPQAWATRDKTEDLTGKSSSPFLAAQVNRFAAGAPFQAWCEQWATECLRVLKPGGHMLAFGGSRTWHRLAAAVEDAGFELRDSIAWLYGSGFPKSLDVSKAIDKAAVAAPLWDEIREHLRRHRDAAGMTNTQLNEALGLCTTGSGMAAHWTRSGPNQQAIPSKEMWQRLAALLLWDWCELDAIYAAVKDGADRPVVGAYTSGITRGVSGAGGGGAGQAITAPATPDAARWQGWGTALKPAFEPIVVGRKPLAGNVAANVLAHGTGALNIDGCRVETAEALRGSTVRDDIRGGRFAAGHAPNPGDLPAYEQASGGRWPTNVVLDGHAADELDRQSGVLTSGTGAVKRVSAKGGDRSASIGAESRAEGTPMLCYGDTGGASRFFPTFHYEAKAPTAERPRAGEVAHPTVKPLDLMRWLVRLVTPPGGTVLEPFAGSGTTAEACVIEGFRCIAIEREADYLPLIVARLSKPIQVGLDFGEASA